MSADVALVLGELGGVFFDELAPAVGGAGIDEYIFDMAMSRLRQPGMTWYACKGVSNNPDESHWTYRRFVEGAEASGTPAYVTIAPLQARGFTVMQEALEENLANLPPGYYERLRKSFAHRPDLVRRFVDGRYGFQQVGRPVTPEWSDDLHLGSDLEPVKGEDLVLLWDGGLNPTCLVTQFTPMGHWLILESYVGSGIGTYELIKSVVKPVMNDRYRGVGRAAIVRPSSCRMDGLQGEVSGDVARQSSGTRACAGRVRFRIPDPRNGKVVFQSFVCVL